MSEEAFSMREKRFLTSIYIDRIIFFLFRIILNLLQLIITIMIVSKNTKISKILKEKPEAVEVIASINKHFRKLKNPILRKVLAPRVTVKDAASIGKTEINVFLKKLQSIGFEVAFDTTAIKETKVVQKQKVNHENIVELDVRPTIETGADPFSEIMGAVKKMKEGETLKIINVFEPIPLIDILKNKGYKTWTDSISTNEYHTYFSKQTSASHQKIVAEMPFSEESFDGKLLSYGENIREIDVRHLEMPEPMVTILKEIELLPEDHVLLVNHKKVPQFLLPELESRNFEWMHKDIAPGDTTIIIFKA